jgi:hypothetical protein
VGQSSGAGSASGSGRGTGPTGLTPETDHVQLSNLGAHLAAALGNSPSHLQKTSSLAGAVLHGGYQVDSQAVSESVIRHSLQFGGANYL